MSNYKLIVDSSCDIPFEYYEKYNIGVTDLLVYFNERIYRDRKDITSSEILKMVEDTKVLPKTSALNIKDLMESFKCELDKYDHIFYMPISSGISSTYNNAILAANELKANDKITVLDSTQLSGGCALLALGIIRDIHEGLDYKAIEVNHNNRLNKVSMQFVIDTMEFLHKGGRCSGLTYLLGNKFHIHPIISLEKGKMCIHTLVRGKDINKGVMKMVEEFKNQFDKNNIDLTYPIFIPHVEGEYGVKRIIHELESIVGDNIIFPVEASGIITCHCGKDTVGLGYMLKKPIL